MSKKIGFHSVAIFGLGLFTVAFDVLVMCGWFISVIGLLAGINMTIRAQRLPKEKWRIPIALFAIFGITTTFGYSLSKFVESDMLEFSMRHPNAPADRLELLKLGECQLSWATRLSLISYSNVDSVALARIRSFPYAINEYNFNKKSFSKREFD